MSVPGIKLGVSKGYLVRTLVCLVGGETGVVVLGQEDVMCNGKKAL